MVVFCFSKKKVDALAEALGSLRLTTAAEQHDIHTFIQAALSRQPEFTSFLYDFIIFSIVFLFLIFCILGSYILYIFVNHHKVSLSTPYEEGFWWGQIKNCPKYKTA